MLVILIPRVHRRWENILQISKNKISGQRKILIVTNRNMSFGCELFAESDNFGLSGIFVRVFEYGVVDVFVIFIHCL